MNTKNFCARLLWALLTALVVMSAPAVQAGPLDMQKATFSEALIVATRTSTATGSAVDLVDYTGWVAFTLLSGPATAGTTPTLNVKVTHADTSGGSYTDVTGATFTEVTTTGSTQTILVNSDSAKRYIKIVGTIAGTDTPTFAFGVGMAGFKDSQ